MNEKEAINENSLWRKRKMKSTIEILKSIFLGLCFVFAISGASLAITLVIWIIAILITRSLW